MEHPCPEVPRMGGGGLYSVLGTFLRCLHNNPAAALELLMRPKLLDGLGFLLQKEEKKKGAGGLQYSVSRQGFLKSEPKVAVSRHLNYCEDSRNPQPGVPCEKSSGYCTAGAHTGTTGLGRNVAADLPCGRTQSCGY